MVGMKKSVLSFFVVLLSLFFIQAWSAVEDFAFMGLPLKDKTRQEIRQYLFEIGGFQQAAHLGNLRNYDKYFPLYRMKDTYYIEFYFDKDKKLQKFRRVFRPQTGTIVGDWLPIGVTQWVAEISKMLGEKTKSVQSLKVVGGFVGRYYEWQSANYTLSFGPIESPQVQPLVLEFTKKSPMNF